MNTLKLVLLIVLVAALGLVIIQNQTAVETRFLWITVSMPAVLLLFLTASSGFVLGILASFFIKKKPHDTKGFPSSKA